MSTSESPSLTALQARFDSPDAAVRLVALREVADACSAELLPLVERALGDAEAEVRLEAVLALDAIGGAESVAPLIRALGDTDEDVRGEAAKALAELQDAGGAGLLLAALSEAGDAWTLAALFDALKPLRHPASLPPALSGLDHADATVRIAAIGVIGYLQSPDTLSRLAALAAHDPVAAVRHAALRALVSGAPEQVAQAALAALKDAEWLIRAEAATILGKLRHAAAAEPLTGLLDFEAQWQVREQAAETLGLLQYKPAIAAVGRCLQSPVSNLRKAAVIALGRIGDRSVRLLLAGVRNDPDAQVRKLAGQLLERLEQDAAGA